MQGVHRWTSLAVRLEPAGSARTNNIVAHNEPDSVPQFGYSFQHSYNALVKMAYYGAAHPSDNLTWSFVNSLSDLRIEENSQANLLFPLM